ncbi:MAG: hypothetical protein EHM79_20395, partial [Geobacter sp.]
MINTSLSLQAQNAAVPVERNTPVTSLSDAGAVTVSPENPETKDGYTASRSKERKYTFLVYEAGANNLDDCIVADINDMESAPPSDNYHIVMQHSRYHIKPSTASFLSAAIAHALESRYFMEKLEEIVKDRQLAEKYGQLFKDPEQCSSIAQILLNKNPGLNDHLDEVTQHVIKDTVAGDQAIIDALKKTT